MADYSVNPGEHVLQYYAPAASVQGLALAETRCGHLGGAVLRELVNRSQGNGLTTIVLPDGIWFGMHRNGPIPDPSGIDDDDNFAVWVRDPAGGTWPTLVALAAELHGIENP